MKKNVLKLRLILVIIVFISASFIAKSQIKVANNGYVGIGSATTPSYKLEINSILSVSKFSNRRTLQISHYGYDPRLQSNERIVFLNTYETGYIDIQCKTAYQYSDSSAKENIKPLEEHSLDKILQLNAVSYNWKKDGNQKSENKKKEIGFIAQEVERIIPDVVYTIDSTNQKLLAYSQIIPYLTEAISELNDKITVLESNLKSKNKSGSINNENKNENETGAKLFQNAPNPFNVSTTVNYTIPADCQNSTINIFDMKGTPIKYIELTNKGEGSIIIDARELNAGMYIYALIVDGKIIDSKNMILTNK
jgi:hypothetical protein